MQLWDAAKTELRRDEMRACLHDQAVVETVASEGRAVGADEAVEMIRTALLVDPLYLEGVWLYDEIAPEVVLTAMHVREHSAGGDIQHQSYYRLTSGSSALIWRQRLFRRREHALDCLSEQGASLGL